ncbi:MAG: hypothetical protein ACI9LZ_003663 [Glaciecola sp.]|jgi:hypothetical protein
MGFRLFDEEVWQPISGSYFTFFPPIESVGFPNPEFAVARTLALSCLGFLTSLFPRLLLPFDILISSNLQSSGSRLQCGEPKLGHVVG